MVNFRNRGFALQYLKFVTLMLIFVQTGCAGDNYYYKNGKKEYLNEKKLFRSTNTKVYETQKGLRLGISNKIILKLRDDSSLDDYLIEYDLQIVKKLYDKVYLLQTSDSSVTLKIANSLYEKEDVVYAHPDFVKKTIKR